MKKNYFLKNAIMLNTTREKYDSVAIQMDINEIRKHKRHFNFDFVKLLNEKNFVYKICRYDEPDILQGIVAFFG